ncbi:Ig-like domain-containing protein [Paenibacillus sp. GXUN7292]|uniref:Ig-like domain-containing protein n=1 Tax=Paenibacillus sp. GXUN7292 TaxID=3422499 RepID=UPI003D7E64CB
MKLIFETSIKHRRVWITYMILFGIVFTAVMAIRTATVYSSTADIQLYVSPSGSGEVCTESSPCSLEQAQLMVRTLNADMEGDITINLLGGKYIRTSTLTLTNEDSGTNGFNIIYRAMPGQQVIFDGGQELDDLDWQLFDADSGIYQAIVPAELETRQLYVDGQRAYRASSEKSPVGWGVIEQGYEMQDDVMSSWSNKQDIEVVILRWWQMHRCPVESITGTQLTIESACWSPFGHTNEKPTWIENAYELLDEAGEWYLDRTGVIDGTGVRKLYYKPLNNTNIAETTFVVPRLQTFLTAEGTIQAPIHNIQIEGITFQHTAWLEPSDWGYIERQGGLRYTRDIQYENGWGDTTVKVPSALNFRAAHNIVLERNVFRHFGASALNFEYGSQNNQIIGNVFEDLSAGAMFIGSTNDHHPADAREIVKNNVVNNNLIKNVAVEYYGTTAIWVGYTEKTKLHHNEIDFVPYSGVSMGWGWGATDAGGAAGFSEGSVARDNEIAYNKITNVSQVLHDGGAIYTLGAQENSTIHHNVVDGVARADYPLDNAIYLDEASRYFAVHDNVISNTYHWIFLWTASIRDNMIYNNFTDTARLRNDGVNNSITNTTVVQNGNWPSAAQAIIAEAGIEAQYADIKNKTSSQRNLQVVRNYAKQSDSNGYYTGLEGEISSFQVAGQSCSTRIDPILKKLFLCVPEGTDVSALVPQLTLLPGHTVTPAPGSTVDFTQPVVYTVTTPKNSEVQWTTQVIITGDAINGSIVDEHFYSLSAEINDLEHWSGGTVERVSDGIVSKRNFTTYTGKKFGDEILDFYMELPLHDWNGFALRTANPNQSFMNGNSNYLVVVTQGKWELQKWVKGAREMLIGSFNEYTPRWGNLANTQFKSNKKHRIQVGVINVDEGVRIVMYVDGEKIFDVVDTVEPFRNPGYFSIYSANSPITLSPAYSPETTNVALNKNSALMNTSYSGYVFPQENKDPGNGNDGDLSTATQAIGSWDWAYIVDLGAVYTINSMAVQFEQNLYASSYELNWKDEDDNWQTLAVLTGEGDRRQVYKLPTSIKAQYVGVKALVPNGPNQLGGQMSIKEFEVHGWIPVESISLERSELSMDIGENYVMNATVLPEQSTDKRLAWRSSAPDVVLVDDNGKLTAISAGTTTITAVSMDGSVFAEADVIVNIRDDGNVAFQRPAKGLHPTTYAELGYHVGSEPSKGVDGSLDTFAQAIDSYAWIYAVDLGAVYGINRVEATFALGYATQYEFVSSLDGLNWTVLQSGTGEAYATRSYFLSSEKLMRYVGIRAVKPDGPGQPGGQMAIANFAAYDLREDDLIYPTAITLDTENFMLEVAERRDITATIIPSDASSKAIVWSSSNPSVATVNAAGRVKAMSTGSATITATAEMGGAAQSVLVTVIESQSGNLALMRPAKVYDLDGNELDVQPDRPASAGVDGDSETAVQASGSYAWQYVVDLGGMQPIRSAAVTFHDGFASEYEWLGSVDGTQWDVLATRTDGHYWTRFLHTFASVQEYRYIAIKALKPDGPYQSGGQMVISEVEIYSTAEAGVSPTGITLDQTAVEMMVGDRITIQAIVTPEDANKQLIWTSSNESIVSVDGQGKLTAKGEGTATVTATTAVGGFSAAVSVEVNPNANIALFKHAAAYQNDLTQGLATHANSPASAAVDGDESTNAQADGSYAWSLVVDLGESYEVEKLSVLFGDGFATQYAFMGYVENEGWQVLYNGTDGALNKRVSYTLAEPISIRYAAIQSLKPDGPSQLGGQMFVKEFEVFQKQPEVAPTSLTLDKESIQLVKREAVQLNAQVLPSHATNKTVIWTSSNELVATVDANGKVTAISAGTSTIKAVTAIGNFGDSIAVTVVNADASGNLALFKPAAVYDEPNGQVLGTHAGRSPYEGVDRKTDTMVQADGRYTWTYIVDLEQSNNIGRLKVTFGDGFATQFRLLGSTNGMTWTTIAEKSASAHNETVTHELTQSQSYRYIGVQALKPDGPHQIGGQMVIAELEVYAAQQPQVNPPYIPHIPDPRDEPGDTEGEPDPSTAQPVITFSDTKGHWAQSYIEEAVKRGIVKGYADGSFKPNEVVTRAMFATMLNRMLKFNATSDAWMIKDSNTVPSWASGHLKALMEKSILTGYADGTIRANAPLTRTELVVVVARAMQLKIPEQPVLPFADAQQIANWAKPYIAAAYEAGLVSGIGVNRFAPEMIATRAELVKLLLSLGIDE